MKRMLITVMGGLYILRDKGLLSRANKEELRRWEGIPKSSYRIRKVNPNTASFDEWIAKTPNYHVKFMLRMKVECFRLLVDKVGSSRYLYSSESHCRRNDCQHVPPITRLAITVMILGGISALVAANCFNVNGKTAYKYFLQGISAIEESHNLFIPRNAFDTTEKLNSLAEGFNKKTWNYSSLEPAERTMQGCVGAIDGVIFKMIQPSVLCPKSYRNRKGGHAIVSMAVCDSEYKFIFFDSGIKGSVHDMTGFRNGSLHDWLYPPNCPGPLDETDFWIAGDNAFVNNNSLLTPFAKLNVRNADTFCTRRSYNEKLSSLRVHIEQAFGILIAKFRILKNIVNRSYPDHVSAIADACACLHNHCREFSIATGTEEPMPTLASTVNDQHGTREATVTENSISGHSFPIQFNSGNEADIGPRIIIPDKREHLMRGLRNAGYRFVARTPR